MTSSCSCEGAVPSENWDSETRDFLRDWGLNIVSELRSNGVSDGVAVDGLLIHLGLVR